MTKFNNHFGTFLLAVLLLILTGTIYSYAVDKPNPPKNLTATLEDTGKDIAVNLAWERDTAGTQPNYFFIYMVAKDSDDPSEFKLFAKVPNEHGEQDFHFLVHQLPTGQYSFFVTAVLFHDNQKLESDPSNIVKVSLVQKPFVRVSHADLLHGRISELFHFLVKAETNTDCNILFGLLNGPEGMTIDQVTGNVAWIPLQNGFFGFRVKAWLDCDTSVFAIGEFKVQVGDSSQGQFYLHIVSKPNERGMPGVPYIYEVKAESNVDCPIIYELLPEHPDAMTIDPHTGVISWTPLNNGFYHVGIRAHLDCHPDITSVQNYTIIVGNDTSHAVIKIISQPPTHAAPNSEYVYDVKAYSNINCPIIFELLESPDGMVINQQTGHISWQTPAEGTFNVAVKASLDCRPEISFTQKFEIRVGEGEIKPFCALILGPVMFENGDTVKEGVVKAVRIDSSSEKHPLFVGQIKNGVFHVGVNEGTYLLQFNGSKFIPEWYENSRNMDSATKIVVVCKDTITLNVVVAKIPEPKHFKVSGKVTSEADGSPVRATVEFIPVERMHGRDGNEKSKDGFRTNTDDQGNYEISLPNNFTYIAHAIPSKDEPRYLDEFYDNVSDPLEADILELTGDLTGIDFSLPLIQQYNNGFSGYVINGTNDRIKSRVITHLIKSKDGRQYKFNLNTETDDQGNFSFHNLIPGEYVVLSIPFDKMYIPGYYKFQDFVVHKWREATRIVIADQLNDQVIEVKHDTRDTTILGVAHINGNISSVSMTIGKSGDHTQTGEPVAGAFVYAINENGDVSDYLFTDDLGNFDLSQLSVGTYTIVSDKVGYYPYEQAVSTDYQTKSNVSLDFTMTQQPSEVSDVTVNGNTAVIYPSPVDAKATIKFNASAGNSRLILYNSNGLQLDDYNVQTVEGNNSFELNLSNVPSGAYFIRIITLNSIITVPVRVIR